MTATTTYQNAQQHADPGLVLADRVEQLYGQLWLGIIGTFAIGALATFELWEPRYKDLVLFWWCVVVLVTACSVALLYGYRNSKNRAAEAEQWLRWLAIAALAGGANWGFAAAVFFPSHTDQQQVFLAFLLAGMLSFGIPVFAGSWPIFALYAGGIVAPFIYVLATLGNRLFTEIALLIPIFYVVNVAIAYRLSFVFRSGYRLRHAYGRLTSDFSNLNQKMEQRLSELEDAREQVEASGRKLALFAERAPIAVLELDEPGNVQQVNQAAELLFGYSAKELKNVPAKNLVIEEGRADFDSRWQNLIETREPLQGLRIRNQRRDGIELTCEWTVTPLVNPDGEILSVIAQGADVTRQLEAERMKKEFTSTLSHELRTPLTSIIGSLQLVNSGIMGDVEKDVIELTEVAERNGQRLLDLINDILDIEKIESGKFTLFVETVRLDELVHESLVLNKAFAERFKVHFDVVGQLPAVEVSADRKRLIQIMTNLLSNAAKFSPEGGGVEITMADTGDTVRVDIHDRGPGIPEAFRGRMFSRFSQADQTTARQKSGTGLGLAICKHLTELMDGTIGFGNREGGGSTFWFDLPKLKT